MKQKLEALKKDLDRGDRLYKSKLSSINQILTEIRFKESEKHIIINDAFITKCIKKEIKKLEEAMSFQKDQAKKDTMEVHALLSGLVPDVQLLDEAETRAFIESHIEDYNPPIKMMGLLKSQGNIDLVMAKNILTEKK